jgi:hypothetical protein
MTPYTVEWPNDVLSDLTTIWLQAPDRRAVTNAQATIDQMLGADPLGNATHLSEGLYKLQVIPLSVTFVINVPQHRVEIYSIHFSPGP